MIHCIFTSADRRISVSRMSRFQELALKYSFLRRPSAHTTKPILIIFLVLWLRSFQRSRFRCKFFFVGYGATLTWSCAIYEWNGIISLAINVSQTIKINLFHVQHPKWLLVFETWIFRWWDNHWRAIFIRNEHKLQNSDRKNVFENSKIVSILFALPIHVLAHARHLPFRSNSRFIIFLSFLSYSLVIESMEAWVE